MQICSHVKTAFAYAKRGINVRYRAVPCRHRRE